MKAEDEIYKPITYSGSAIVDGFIGQKKAILQDLKNECEAYHQSQLQALKEEVVKEVIWAEENQVGEDEEKHIEWNRGYRNAMKTALNLITNLEDNS